MTSLFRMFVLFALLSTWTASAAAQGPTPENKTTSNADKSARDYYDEGLAHYEGGRYLEAQASFAAGYELSKKPGFLWNMGECARLLGNDERAVSLYAQYLEETDEGAPHRDGAKTHIDDLGGKVPTEPGVPSPDPVGPVEPPPSSGEAALSIPPSALPGPVAPGPDRVDEMPDLYERWWFWAGGAGIVITAVVTGIVVASVTGGSDQPMAPAGTFTIDWR